MVSEKNLLKSCIIIYISISFGDSDMCQCVTTGQPIHFGKNNPGFDIAIFTRSEDNQVFVILIETRYSSAESSTIESLPAITSKHDIINEKYGKILEGKGFQWALVYVAFRKLAKTCLSKNSLPENVLVLDIDRLIESYGESFSTPAI